MTVLTEAQIDVWRERDAQRQTDAANLEYNRSRDERRQVAREEMLAFLDGFLNGRISLQQFKDTFDSKTRKEWDVFGLKGASGAMFLNTLVKHLPDQRSIAEELQRVLPVPANTAEGRARLQSFYDYLMELRGQGIVTPSQVQPVRAMFFVSGWWHLQSPDLWPPYYGSGQRALSADNLITNSGDPVADYFAFREVVQELMSGLALPAWELEHLLAWYDEQPVPGAIAPRTEPPPVVVVAGPTKLVGDPLPTTPDETPVETFAESTAHTRVQWQLAKLGVALKCHVWIARNDHSRMHNGEKLGSLSVSAMPNLGMDDDTGKIIGLIDVIWLHGKKVVAAFEIESTTSIFSGILRMSDLLAVSPNINFPLYLVVPKDRVQEVQRQLCRETFKALELPDRCRYFTFEALGKDFESMSRWATGPEAVRKLAQRVECV